MKVLLLHAFPYDEAMWSPQQPVLEGRDVVAPPLYRRGATMDEWASSLLDEVKGELCVVGASMGGGCAVAMARRAPARVHGIVLAGAHAGPDAPERRPEREATIRRLREEGAEAVWAGEGEPPPAEQLIAVVEALRDRPDDRAVVARFAGPLLVVTGSDDPMIEPDAARALADSAPRGRFALVEDAGHLVSIDRPDEFNRHLAGFLEECA